MDKKNTLWNRINSLKIGPPQATFTFTQRLARENGWSTAFSNNVFFEYKRFLYLAAMSDKEITPSDQVDQVWHLHLTYTRSYWKDLCEGILGSKLHHNPTEGGPQQGEKFRHQYQYTLDLYKKTYGETPPEDVWPSVENRFDVSQIFSRVNRKNFWLIKKPQGFTDKILFFTFLPSLLIACTDNFTESDAWFYIMLALGTYIIYKVIRWLVSGNKSDNWKGCDSNRGGGGYGGGSGGCGGCGGCGGGGCGS